MEPAAQHRGELCLGGGKLGNMQRGLRQQGVDHLAGRHGMYFVFTVAVNGHVDGVPSGLPLYLSKEGVKRQKERRSKLGKRRSIRACERDRIIARSGA
jgi:hypothetical protein